MVSADWAQVVCAILNIGVVIWIFWRSERQRNADKAERDRLANREVDVFWVRQFVLEPNRHLIGEFFRKAETLARDCVNHGLGNDGGREYIDALRTVLIQVQGLICDPLAMVHPDFKSCNKVIEDFEDYFNRFIGGDTADDLEAFSLRVETHRRAFNEAIFKTEKAILSTALDAPPGGITLREQARLGVLATVGFGLCIFMIAFVVVRRGVGDDTLILTVSSERAALLGATVTAEGRERHFTFATPTNFAIAAKRLDVEVFPVIAQGTINIEARYGRSLQLIKLESTNQVVRYSQTASTSSNRLFRYDLSVGTR